MVEDDDRLTGRKAIASTRIPLKDVHVDVDAEPGGECWTRVDRPLSPPAAKTSNAGRLLVGLSFLPTSQRIVVHVNQCRHLPNDIQSSVNKSSSNSSPSYVVRILLLNELGRVCKRRKTVPVPLKAATSSNNTVHFNETFHMDVAVDQWDKSVVLVVLNRLQEPVEPAAAAAAAGDNVSTTALGSAHQPPAYVAVSHVALGKFVADRMAALHWCSAVLNPRENIEQWHWLV